LATIIANSVGDNQAEDNCPQHIFDIRQREVICHAIALNRRLNELAEIAQHEEQNQRMGSAVRCAVAGWRVVPMLPTLVNAGGE
jgi:hypothetical protein